MVRAGMVEALRSDYVEMARLNGYEEREVVLRHALRNALAPSVQVIALNIQWLVGGIVVTEYVFGYPGLGQTLVNAVAARDIPFVQCHRAARRGRLPRAEHRRRPAGRAHDPEAADGAVIVAGSARGGA